MFMESNSQKKDGYSKVLLDYLVIGNTDDVKVNLYKVTIRPTMLSRMLHNKMCPEIDCSWNDKVIWMSANKH